MWVSAGRRRAFANCISGMLALVVPFVFPVQAHAQSKVATFTLGNGMQVVVIPDTRVPVVTHMVWYKVGGADDPWSRSGIAHFLEHLMFKATRTIKSGEFTRIVNGLGGRHNALTTHDTTTYFQRVAKEHLRRVMELEADRMTGLQLTAAEVTTERDVIKEERRASVDAQPLSLLNEQMLAALYQNHPYGRPVLGFAHEIAQLSQQDATAFYGQHYAPNNAILVVAGDASESEVRSLAEATYGRVKPKSGVKPRQRPSEPEAIAQRTVLLEDARAGAPLLLRTYHVPSMASANPGDAEALTLLGRVLGGDDTSRLYRALVLESKLAVQSGADYQGGGLDSGRLSLLALAVNGKSPQQLERAIDDVVSRVVADGVTMEELVRAKRAIEAELVFASDNQERLARRYGEALATGRTVADVEAFPGRIEAVTLADIKRAAVTFLIARRAVTGVLVRPPAPSIAAAEPAPTVK